METRKKTKGKMSDLYPNSISVITFNIDELNTPAEGWQIGRVNLKTNFIPSLRNSLQI